jgi:hypothetical protein
MNEQPLARLEARLERLIEGAFAHVFTRAIRAQDVILHLARALTAAAQMGSDGDPRAYAPDHFQVRLHPTTRADLLVRLPDIEATLARQIVALATDGGYRLRNLPHVQLIGDESLLPAGIDVRAEHQPRVSPRTAKLERIDITPVTPLAIPTTHTARNPQLVIDGERTLMLTDEIINVGRSRDNQVVLDDPRISRHHIQFRQRGGAYWVFDSDSTSGTYVNNVSIREHMLQPGDVIQIGSMQLVYLEDAAPDTDEATSPLTL